MAAIPVEGQEVRGRGCSHPCCVGCCFRTTVREILGLTLSMLISVLACSACHSTDYLQVPPAYIVPQPEKLEDYRKRLS